jgi:hypothetical protein
MTLPRLTELQVAALACVRDNVIVPTVEYLSWRKLYVYRAFPGIRVRVAPRDRRGFNVTCQIHSFRKRGLVKLRERLREGAVYELTPAGIEELSRHPEY